MKRLISLFLVFALCLSFCLIFASCSEDAPEKEPLTEEEWKELLHSKNFENYTVAITHNIVPDEKKDDPIKIALAFKVAGDEHKVFRVEESAEESDRFNEDVAEITEQKGIYYQIFQRMRLGFDEFTYDAEKDEYKLSKRFEIIEAGDEKDVLFNTGSYVTHSYYHPLYGAVSTPALDIKNATKQRIVTGTAITLKVDEDGRISEVSFTYIDSIIYTDKKTNQTLDSSSVTVDVTWTFSDYGTTVID